MATSDRTFVISDVVNPLASSVGSALGSGLAAVLFPPPTAQQPRQLLLSSRGEQAGYSPTYIAALRQLAIGG